jgi:hypothetical protein
MCFLRSEGLTGEAQRIEETEFAQASADARSAASSEFEAESLMRTFLAEEQERVAQAIAFAEVLVPMIVERIGPMAPGQVRAPVSAARKPRVETPAEARGIADFIDDMLTQDRAGAH